MSELSAALRRRLWEAIAAAFTKDDLNELLAIDLGVRLERIAADDNLNKTVLEVFAWAERDGRLQELLSAVKRARPLNSEVQVAVDEYRAALPAVQIFISYKRNVVPDEPLALRLRAALEQAGYRIFIDQKIAVGLDWADEIRRQIEQSDFMLVLLSDASVHSEMVVEEVIYAAKQTQEAGKARLIPVRVAFDEPLPYQLGPVLDRLQYATWHEDADDAGLLQQIRAAIATPMLAAPKSGREPMAQAPVVGLNWAESANIDATTARPYADPRFLETLDEPGGAVRAKSRFYIERDEDNSLRRELAKAQGTTTTIRAARQTGKSSLLVSAIATAKQRGRKVAYIDLQPIDEPNLQTLDTFLRYFASAMVSKLRLDPEEVEKAWRGSLGSPDKTTYLLEEFILPSVPEGMVLAVDEADRLLKTPFHDSFFGLLRFWHNSRALDELWERLDIVMVISTEPHLLIADVTQSPFNVGHKIRLQDFTPSQVGELNRRYLSPCRDVEVAELAEYLHGHPYLTHKAVHTLVTEQMAWPELRRLAPGEHSPFGDHLRRYLWLLREQPSLCKALQQVLRHGECPDEVSFYRMLQAGLIQGIARNACTARCKLYEEFFADKL